MHMYTIKYEPYLRENRKIFRFKKSLNLPKKLNMVFNYNSIWPFFHSTKVFSSFLGQIKLETHGCLTPELRSLIIRVNFY